MTRVKPQATPPIHNVLVAAVSAVSGILGIRPR
jgi:hypothetical protein